MPDRYWPFRPVTVGCIGKENNVWDGLDRLKGHHVLMKFFSSMMDASGTVTTDDSVLNEIKIVQELSVKFPERIVKYIDFYLDSPDHPSNLNRSDQLTVPSAEGIFMSPNSTGKCHLVLILEKVETSMADLLNSATPLELQRQFNKSYTRLCKYFAWGGLEALACMHCYSITHRTICPQNIILTKKTDLNSVKLGDFSKAIRRNAGIRDNYTEVNNMINYSAPEVLENDGYGLSSDIFSLGVVLYEMAYGENPFPLPQGPAELEPEVSSVLENTYAYNTVDPKPPNNGNEEYGSKSAKFYLISKFLKSVKTTKHARIRAKLNAIYTLKEPSFIPAIGFYDPGPLFQDFIRKMLQLNASLRPQAQELLKHKWFVEKDSIISNGYYANMPLVPHAKRRSTATKGGSNYHIITEEKNNGNNTYRDDNGTYEINNENKPSNKSYDDTILRPVFSEKPIQAPMPKSFSQPEPQPQSQFQQQPLVQSQIQSAQEITPPASVSIAATVPNPVTVPIPVTALNPVTAPIKPAIRNSGSVSKKSLAISMPDGNNSTYYENNIKHTDSPKVITPSESYNNSAQNSRYGSMTEMPANGRDSLGVKAVSFDANTTYITHGDVNLNEVEDKAIEEMKPVATLSNLCDISSAPEYPNGSNNCSRSLPYKQSYRKKLPTVPKIVSSASVPIPTSNLINQSYPMNRQPYNVESNELKPLINDKVKMSRMQTAPAVITSLYNNNNNNNKPIHSRSVSDTSSLLPGEIMSPYEEALKEQREQLRQSAENAMLYNALKHNYDRDSHDEFHRFCSKNIDNPALPTEYVYDRPQELRPMVYKTIDPNFEINTPHSSNSSVYDLSDTPGGYYYNPEYSNPKKNITRGSSFTDSTSNKKWWNILKKNLNKAVYEDGVNYQKQNEFKDIVQLAREQNIGYRNAKSMDMSRSLANQMNVSIIEANYPTPRLSLSTNNNLSYNGYSDYKPTDSYRYNY